MKLIYAFLNIFMLGYFFILQINLIFLDIIMTYVSLYKFKWSLYNDIFLFVCLWSFFLKDLYRAKNKYLCFLYNSVLAMVRVFSHQIAIVAITCARFGDYSRRRFPKLSAWTPYSQGAIIRSRDKNFWIDWIPCYTIDCPGMASQLSDGIFT